MNSTTHADRRDRFQSCSPGEVSGQILAPSSKSMMQRAVGAATQVPGWTTILCPSFSDDGNAALRVARALGSEVLTSTTEVRIKGGGTPTGDPLDCGESGYSMRMFSALASTYSKELTLVAHGSLTRRPVSMVEGPLTQAGVNVRTSAGFPPVTVCGPLRGGRYTVDGSASSQFLSGFLMALPICEGDSIVETLNLKSKPYVLMTIELLREFGIAIDHNESLSTISIPGGQRYREITYTVEGDWSGASFPLVAGAIAGRVTVDNLRENSKQADRAIIQALIESGAEVTINNSGVTVERGQLRGFNFNATDCPDLFPPLVSLAACCDGVTNIKGASRLADKESDRASALKSEFGKLGIRIDVDGDVMRVYGGEMTGGEVYSHADHRIAMACGVAALRARSAVLIREPGCIAKSYPEFFKDLASLVK